MQPAQPLQSGSNSLQELLRGCTNLWKLLGNESWNLKISKWQISMASYWATKPVSRDVYATAGPFPGHASADWEKNKLVYVDKSCQITEFHIWHIFSINCSKWNFCQADTAYYSVINQKVQLQKVNFENFLEHNQIQKTFLEQSDI